MTTVAGFNAHADLVELAATVVERSDLVRPEELVTDRTVWMFWGGPLPEHVAACIGRAEQRSGGCDLVVVTPRSARTFAPELPARWEGLGSWAHKSDILAPHLLRSYGGLYVDADTIVLQPLDVIIDDFDSGEREYVAYLNVDNEPSVGVMWGRAGSPVADAYCDVVDQALAERSDDPDWVAFGTPLLASAFAACNVDLAQLDPMLGHVALFSWQAWRTLALPAASLDPYFAALSNGGKSLALVAIYHSRSGPLLEARSSPTIFDELLSGEPQAAADPAPTTSDARVTFLIKTFNRPATISHTVAKLRQRFPSEPVIVVDDSSDGYLADLAPFSVAHLVIPFDAGLSRGRNIGILHIDTPYFLMHDDDQFPAENLDLDAALGVLDADQRIDIAGGWEDETPHVRDSFELTDDRVLIQRRHTPWGHLDEGADATPLFHMVQNQTLWRTSSIRDRKLKWSNQLKVGEHVDFFFRYRGAINIVFLRTLHFANVPPGIRSSDSVLTDYGSYRNRQRTMWNRSKKINNIERIEVMTAMLPVFPYRTAPIRTVLRNVGRLLHRRADA